MNRRSKKKDSYLKRNSLPIMIVCVAIALLVVGCGMFCRQGYSGFSTWLHFQGIESGSAMRDSLKTHLGSSMGTKVWILWKLQSGSPEKAHGAYEINHGNTAINISRRLVKGIQSPIKVTFNNVRTVAELSQRVTRNLEVTPEEFMQAVDSQLSQLGFNKTEYPAAFIPDTYEFYYTVNPDKLVRTLINERNSFWTPSRIAQAEALGLNPVQVATLASIVEEETAKADERPKVARLYLNRLNKQMKLQADPTVKFAIGDFSIRRITRSMLTTRSPYNTYLIEGLPPGPIRVPERNTLEAVLNAPTHPYIFMCAREDFSGYHNFATDYPSHQANARRYQQELNRRNIR